MTEKTLELTPLATPDLISSGSTRVFVYGTLKSGHGNNHLLSQSRFIGRSSLNISGKFVDLGPFPGLVPGEDLGDTTVYGELYEVNEPTLKALDFLEGHPRFYERRKVKTLQDCRVWVYCLPREYETHDEVEAGLWRPTDAEYASWAADEGDEIAASG